MKKTILATSVIALLAGCGSDSSSPSTPSPSGFTVTGFDGYLQNAVVYIDKDGSSSFSDSSEFVGLTDESGTLTLDAMPSEQLSLQMLVSGEPAQQVLAGMDSKYETVYTTDSDRPSMPLDAEYSLHTTQGAEVISPLTDLVVLEMKESGTDVDTAIAVVQGALGLDSDSDLYVDFVDNGDKKLHKTAQILADSKAESPIAYELNPMGFATDTKIAVDQIPADNLSDPNYRMIVDGDTGTNDSIPTGSDTYVNPTVFNAVQAQFDALDLTYGYSVGTPITLFEADLSDLFKDSDNTGKLTNYIHVSNTASNYVVVDKYNEKTGLVAYVNDGKLRVGMNSSDEIKGSGGYFVVVQYEGEDSDTNKAQALFTFKVKIDDSTPPVLITNEQNLAQAKVYDTPMVAGIDIAPIELDLNSIFNSHGKDIGYSLTQHTINGFNISLDGSMLTIDGSPTVSGAKDTYTIEVVGNSGSAETTLSLNLPEILAVPNDIAVMENQVLYRAVLNLHADIRKCEAIQLISGEIYSILGDNKSDCPTTTPNEINGDLIGNYSINNGRLIAFSGKVPADNAEPRYLLSTLTASDSDDGEVTRYLVQNGITATPETYSVEFYDKANNVEKVVKDNSDSSWAGNSVANSTNINGEYVSTYLMANSGSYLYLQIDDNSHIFCKDLAGQYSHYELGIMTDNEFQSLSKLPIYDVCNDDPSNQTTIDFGIDSGLGNQKYVHVLHPHSTSNAPYIQREWIETRD
ncbi:MULTISPECIES: hypothetical protein [Vibrio]|nr:MULTISPECIES: hypothetical protein [Vibrio]MBN8105524.1 hypothetical protein [Vibrio vulnificus]MDW2326983.1 hypothetical protein [Vibrio sp. 1401]